MTVQECIQYVESHLEIRPATDNGAYTSGRTIKPAGCVNHSVGCAQPSVDVFFNTMNKSSAGWGVNALLGDFHKGEGRIILALQWNGRPWGCGSGSKGSWNNTKVQWEICEPAGHTYAGGTMVGYDVAKNQGYFDRMWKMKPVFPMKYFHLVTQIDLILIAFPDRTLSCMKIPFFSADIQHSDIFREKCI